MNRRKETANKGFSLVELIIVVAIMAVLIGVLAPQYLKYVERSRESADLDNYQAIITALQINAADAEATYTLTGGQISFTKGGNPTFTTTNAKDVLEDASVDPSKLTTKSDKYGTAEIKIDVTGVVPEFSTNNSDLAGALGIEHDAAITTPTTTPTTP